MSGSAAAVLTKPAFRKIEWLPRDIAVEPPSIDGNELTDKGYINQRAGLERRADLVGRLCAARPDQDVIILNQ
jgi:hypothetical protein